MLISHCQVLEAQIIDELRPSRRKPALQACEIIFEKVFFSLGVS